MSKSKCILCAFGIIATFTSCLKDKKIDEKTYGTNDLGKETKIVELPYQASKLHNISLDASPVIEEINAIEVNLPNGQLADQDVTVTLVKNMTLVSDWNTANGTNYIDMPTNSYSIVNPNGLTVTIPKGSNKGFLKLRIDKNNFDYSATYGVGFSIATVTSGYAISQNFQRVIINLAVKNKFDGTYNLRFKMLDWQNNTPFTISNQIWDWPTISPTEGSIHFVTSGPNSVKMFDNWGFGTYIHPARSTTGWTGFGSTAPKFFFDASNNLTAAVNDIVGLRTFNLNPAVTDNRWTPTKIYIAMIMKQTGRSDLQIFDTLSYVGPR